MNEAIQKNGGSSYGIMLEGSPDPIRDQANERSSTYDLSLHESYPDRITVIARFSFDPVKKQLFERDVIEDTLIPISFDSKLLLNSPCFKN
ncbi:MAG: hypothetical protein IPP31_11365 [Chitinophagaceae bacterium]|nr:hypothetical protein [Chitinophagaceae bacterium]